MRSPEFNRPPRMSNDEILTQAKQRALKEAHQDGLQIGTVVGLYYGTAGGDGKSYELLEVNGDTAVIGYENKTDGKIRKEAPLKDLLDVNRVQDIAFEIKSANILTPEVLDSEVLN
ncbi:MAG: hypothetical protein V1716_03975 [Candidatus Uhrbacteria bacterium]